MGLWDNILGGNQAGAQPKAKGVHMADVLAATQKTYNDPENPILWTDPKTIIDDSDNHYLMTGLKVGANDFVDSLEMAPAFLAAGGAALTNWANNPNGSPASNWLNQKSDELQLWANRNRKEYRNANIPQDGIGQFAYNVAQNAPQLGATVAAAALTGGTGAGLLMAGNIGGSAFRTAKENGASNEAAAAAAGTDAAIQSVLESAGAVKILGKPVFSTLLSRSPKLAQLVRDAKSPEAVQKIKARLGTFTNELIETAATEGGTEYAQQYADTIVPELARAIDEGGVLDNFDPNNIDWNEAHNEALMAGYVGAFLGAGGAATRMGINKARGRNADGTPKVISNAGDMPETPQATLEQDAEAAPQTAQYSAENAQVMPNAQQEQKANQYTGTPLGSIARTISDELGWDPSWCYAVAAHESNRGKNAPHNNYFGYKHVGDDENYFESSTWELDENGNEQEIVARFQKYDTPEDSARAYARWIKDNCTEEEIANVHSAADVAALMKKHGYYTDTESNYAASLTSLAEEYKQNGGDTTIRSNASNPRGIANSDGRESAPRGASPRDYLEDYAMNNAPQDEKGEEAFRELDDLLANGTDEEVEAKARELGWQEEAPQEETPPETPEAVAAAVEERAPEVAPPVQQGQGDVKGVTMETPNLEKVREAPHIARQKRAEQEASGQRRSIKVPEHITKLVRDADNGDAQAKARIEAVKINPQVIEAAREEIKNAENEKDQPAQSGQERHSEDLHAEPQEDRVAESEALPEGQNVEQYTPPEDRLKQAIVDEAARRGMNPDALNNRLIVGGVPSASVPTAAVPTAATPAKSAPIAPVSGGNTEGGMVTPEAANNANAGTTAPSVETAHTPARSAHTSTENVQKTDGDVHKTAEDLFDDIVKDTEEKVKDGKMKPSAAKAKITKAANAAKKQAAGKPDEADTVKRLEEKKKASHDRIDGKQEKSDDSASAKKNNANAEKTADKGGIVVVTGDEFGEYSDIKELREKALEYYAKNLQGTTVNCPVIGRVEIDTDGLVAFTGSGKREVKNSSAKEHKLLLVKYLPELIRNAEGITDKYSTKEKHAKEHFYYLTAKAVIEGQEMPVDITLIKRNNGEIQYYNHTLQNEEKKNFSGKEKDVSVSQGPVPSGKKAYGTPAIHTSLSATSTVAEAAPKVNEAKQLKYEPEIAGIVSAFKKGDLTQADATQKLKGIIDSLNKVHQKDVSEEEYVRLEKIWHQAYTAGAEIHALANGKSFNSARVGERWDTADGVNMVVEISEDNGKYYYRLNRSLGGYLIDDIETGASKELDAQKANETVKVNEAKQTSAKPSDEYHGFTDQMTDKRREQVVKTLKASRPEGMTRAEFVEKIIRDGDWRVTTKMNKGKPEYWAGNVPDKPYLAHQLTRAEFDYYHHLRQLKVVGDWTQSKKKAAEPKAKAAEKIGGKETEVQTDSGKKVQAKYCVMSADRLQASHDTDFTENKNYDASLQPRDRQRGAMQEQVKRMANALDPERLGAGRTVNDGAPVVNPDGMVENGNGRTIAIKTAYEGATKQHKASAERYKQYLIDHAEEFGLDADVIRKMDKPILVRERSSIVDEATQRDIVGSTEGGAKMSSSEQGKADAKKLDYSHFKDYDTTVQDGLLAERNLPVVHGILNAVIKDNEKNAMYTENGRDISNDGMARVKNAIWAVAFGDHEYLNDVAEKTPDEGRRVLSAMQAASPRLAAVRLAQRDGIIDTETDIVGEIGKALEQYMRWITSGMSNKRILENELEQGSIFESRSDFQTDLLKLFASAPSKNYLETVMRNVCDGIDASYRDTGANLFGDEVKPVTANEIMHGAIVDANMTVGTKPAYKEYSEALFKEEKDGLGQAVAENTESNKRRAERSAAGPQNETGRHESGKSADEEGQGGLPVERRGDTVAGSDRAVLAAEESDRGQDEGNWNDKAAGAERRLDKEKVAKKEKTPPETEQTDYGTSVGSILDDYKVGKSDDGKTLAELDKLRSRALSEAKTDAEKKRINQKDAEAHADIANMKAAKGMLSEDAFRDVYLPGYETLKQGNTEVKKAAHESALFSALMSDSFAKQFSEDGETMTAADNAPKIVLGGEPDGQTYTQPAKEMKAEAGNLVDFWKLIQKYKEEGWPASAEKWTDENGITYQGERVEHIINKHKLTMEQLQDIADHIGELYDVVVSNRKQKSQYDGVQVIARIEGLLSSYRVNLDFHGNGSVKFDTAFAGGRNEIIKSIEAHASQVLSVTKTAAPISLGKEASMSISMIQKALGIVKSPILYQRASKRRIAGDDVKDLVVMHNISADKLVNASKLGGLPMPSIAITKKGIEFNNFGEITLIGDSQMIDPARGVDVWARDAYTTRFPYVVWDAPKKEDVSALAQKSAEFAKIVGDERDWSRIINSMTNNGLSKGLAASHLTSSPAMMYRYLMETKGKRGIPMEDPKAHHRKVFENDTELLDPNIYGILSRTLNRRLKYGSKAYQELSAKVRTAMENETAAAERQAAETSFEFTRKALEARVRAGKKHLEAYFDESGMLTQKRMDRLYDLVAKAKEPAVDIDALYDKLDEDKAYAAWIDKQVDILYTTPKIMDGSRKLEYNLANIMHVMLKNKGAGKENIGMTPNKMLAMAAKKFSSIEGIRKEKGILRQDIALGDPIYEAFEQAILDFHKAVGAAHGTSAYDPVTDVADVALAEACKGTPTQKKLAAALRKRGISDEPSVIEAGMKTIEAAKKVTTDYFEAKPRRAVEISEFNTAVVPNGTDKAVTDYLRSQGLRVVKYDPKEPGNRQKVTESAAEKAGVYFQEAAGAYDSGENIIHIFEKANASTVMHESAHAWLARLKRAAMNGNAAAVRCLETIQNWACYSEEHMQEYVGTPLEAEFREMEKAIKEAKTPVARLAAEERFIQERFARGFERYLAEGKAPSRKLTKIFEKFKRWMLDIYENVQALGLADPPKEVRAVFDSMLTGERIEDTGDVTIEKIQKSLRDHKIKYPPEDFEKAAVGIKDLEQEMLHLKKRIEAAHKKVDASVDQYRNKQCTMEAMNSSFRRAQNGVYRELFSAHKRVSSDYKLFLNCYFDLLWGPHISTLKSKLRAMQDGKTLNEARVGEQWDTANGPRRIAAIVEYHDGYAYTTTRKYGIYRIDNIETGESKELDLEKQKDAEKVSRAKKTADAKFSLRDDAPRKTNEQLAAEVADALKGATDIEVSEDGTTVTCKLGGNSVQIDLVDRIVITENEAKSASGDYGREVTTSDEAEGVMRSQVTEDGLKAFIELTNDSTPGAVYHEVYHFAEKFMTPKERAVLRRAFGNEEGRAEGYRGWKLKGNTKCGRIFRHIENFCARILGIFRENPTNVLRKIDSGEIFKRDFRKANSYDAVSKLAVTNSRIDENTPVKVIDLDGVKEALPAGFTHAQLKKFVRLMEGKVFTVGKSDGVIRMTNADPVVEYDKETGKQRNQRASEEAIGGRYPGRNQADTKKSAALRRLFSVLEDVLNNGVYVDKHADTAHGTDTDYVEIYGAVSMTGSDGVRDVYRVQLTARERGTGEPNELGSGILYTVNLTKIKGDTQYRYRSENSQSGQRNAPKTVWSIAELLSGVNDREGNPYVKDGKLVRSVRLFSARQKKTRMKLREQLAAGRVFTDNTINDKAEKIEAQQQISDVASAVMEPAAKFSLKNKVLKPVEDYLNTTEARRTAAKSGVNVMGDGGLQKAKTALHYRGWGTFFSPSRILRNDTGVGKFIFREGDNAKRKQSKLFSKWTNTHNEILSSMNEFDASLYRYILLEEDARGQNLTDAELRKEFDANEAVIAAHKKLRELMKEIRSEVNAVKTETYVETKTFFNLAEAEEWEGIRMFTNSNISEVQRDGRKVWQVTYTTPAYHMATSTLTQDDYACLREESERTQKGQYDGRTLLKSYDNGDGTVNATYLVPDKPVADKEGYLPHIFHDFLIVAENPRTKERRVIGSGKTMNEAVEKAKEIRESNKNWEYTIVPKDFTFSDMKTLEEETQEDMLALEGQARDAFSIKLEEAEDAMTNGTGRTVFLSALKHRKGAVGYENNVNWVIQHHISSSSRYCGLQPFKRKAVNVFERRFGPLDGSYTGKDERAEFLQGYINSIMGKPSKAERLMNSILKLMPWFRDMPRPSRTISSSLTGFLSVMKLGASPASALINATQLINGYGYLGGYMNDGIKRASRLSEADRAVLHRIGTEDEVGLESSGILDEARLEAGRYGKAWKAYQKVSDIMMKQFTAVEKFLRRATTLAAYQKAIAEGKSERAAIEYAKDMNRRVNFDYSVADAPRLFRATQGSIIGDSILQFQKYGFKELEVVWDMLSDKSIPKKQKVMFFAPYLLLSGLFNALPFEDLIIGLFGAATGDDDPEATLKKYMIDAAGDDPLTKEFVKIAMYGVGSAVGIDISQRVGLKSVVPEPGIGVAASTAKQLYQAWQSESPLINSAKAVSTAGGNLAQAVEGYGTDSKGRHTVNYTPEQRVLRLMGFRTIDEAIALDQQSITYAGSQKRTKMRAAAKAAYIKEPTNENRRRLKELGYTDNQIKALKKQGGKEAETRKERAASQLSKAQQKEYRNVMNFDE